MWVSFDRCPDLFLHTQSKSLNARALIQCSYKRYDPSLLSSHGRPRSSRNLSSAFRERATGLISLLLYDISSRGPASSRSRELSATRKSNACECHRRQSPRICQRGFLVSFVCYSATYRDTCPPPNLP